MPGREAKTHRSKAEEHVLKHFRDRARRERDRTRVRPNRGTATERGYTRQHEQRRRQILEEQPYCQCSGCEYCLQPVAGATPERCYRPSEQADHIVPMADGGSNTYDNYQALCCGCHDVKTRGEATARAERHGQKRGRFKVKPRAVVEALESVDVSVQLVARVVAERCTRALERVVNLAVSVGRGVSETLENPGYPPAGHHL